MSSSVLTSMPELPEESLLSKGMSSNITSSASLLVGLGLIITGLSGRIRHAEELSLKGGETGVGHLIESSDKVAWRIGTSHVAVDVATLGPMWAPAFTFPKAAAAARGTSKHTVTWSRSSWTTIACRRSCSVSWQTPKKRKIR